jgi:pimeloyl-ACP methyl ester carboxylesterase
LIAQLTPIAAGTTRLALHDLGGEGPVALLVHGAGLNAACFRPLAGLLASRWRCVGVDLGGHGRSERPASFEWTEFAAEVLAVAESLGDEGLVGVGHSLGASALLGAAARNETVFSSLYCFEPIVISASLPRRPPSGLPEMTRRRRSEFASREEAREHFRARFPFSEFDERALEGYLDDGLELGADGTFRLTCRPEDEAAVYEAGERSDVYGLLGGVKTAVAIGFGMRTDWLSEETVGMVARALGGPSETLPVSGVDHFAPFASPGVIAQSVIRAIGTARA